MARTLFFPKVFRKFSEITNNKLIFSQYNIFYNYEYFLFQSVFDLLSIITEELNQTGTVEFVLWFTLFSSFAVHAQRAFAMLFNIFW